MTPIVISDVRSWPMLIGLTGLGVLALLYEYFVGGVPGVFQWMASLLLVTTVVLAIRGSRHIMVTDDEISVKRRGRIVARQLLEDLVSADASPLGWQRLRFRDGSSIWWIPMDREGGAAVDHLGAWLERNASSRPATGAHTLVPLKDLEVDRTKCVSCGGLPKGSRSLEARRGFSAIVLGSYILRKFLVPVCNRCNWRRRILAPFVYALPVVVGYVLIQVASAVNYEPVSALTLFLWCSPVIASALAVANFGHLIADYVGLGVALGILDTTHSKVNPLSRRPGVFFARRDGDEP